MDVYRTPPIFAASNEGTTFRRFLILVLLFHAIVLVFDQYVRRASFEQTYFSQTTTGITQVRLQLSQQAPTPTWAPPSPKQRATKQLSQTPVTPALASSAPPASINQNRAQEGSGQNTVLAAYVNQIRDQVQKHKSYPTLARRLKQQGIVVLEVTIRNDGLIENIHILQKAHFASLNQAALKALEQARQFAPFPKELEQNQLVVSLPINFKLID